MIGRNWWTLRMVNISSSADNIMARYGLIVRVSSKVSDTSRASKLLKWTTGDSSWWVVSEVNRRAL